MRCSCFSCECKCHYISFWNDWETLYISLLFQSPVENFIFVCEGHDEAFVTIRSSARYEAIRAMKTKFQRVVKALESLNSASEYLQTRGNAQIILLSILFYWEEILGKINLIQKKLREHGIGLDVCVCVCV